jgi:hypothetical protein
LANFEAMAATWFSWNRAAASSFSLARNDAIQGFAQFINFIWFDNSAFETVCF